MYRFFLLFIFTSFFLTDFFAKSAKEAVVYDVDLLLKAYFDHKQKEDSVLSSAQDCFDECEDDFEKHPADGLYQSIWRSDRLNPYSTPVENLSDSIRVDCSDFVLPIKGRVTSHFGFRRHRFHYGTDIKLNTGDSVRVAFAGKVRIIDNEKRGFGRYVVVRHRNGLETVYAHFSRVLVEPDQFLEAGDVIGLGGRTGRATGPHLHFEVRYLGNPIDAAALIDFKNEAVKSDEYLITKAASFSYRALQKSLQAAKYITVRKGDTLSQIAARNRTSVSKLCRLNNMSAKRTIRPGQKIRVR